MAQSGNRPGGGDAVSSALIVDNLVVRFGGVAAVRSLSLTAPVGRVTGLIGPNGAGKSTTFNVCSGLVRPASGRVSFDGVDLTHAPAAQRAHCGIGRTFQRMELFESLSVYENVALGREARLAGTSPLRQLVPRRAEADLVRRAADEAIARCELASVASQRAGLLSTGQKRLVELARALAGQFRLLLLDEPSSGLDAHDSARFAALLRQVVDSTGIGVLIVEHDMSVIADVCDHVYVLDFGELIFAGTPQEVLSSETVRAAYLGTEPISTPKVTA
jgi:ABC-type branched-subunit amino acid transport system ATPase component